MRDPQRLVLKQTTAPTYHPVTLDEAKAHCRIDIGDEDTLLRSLIAAATKHCEHLMHRQIMPATWRLTLDRFPVGLYNDPTSPAIEGHSIILPRPALVSVTHIKYDDEDGTEQTMTAADYRVQADESPARIALAYDAEWPDTRAQVGAVRITYEAGYASSALTEAQQQAAVPQNIKQAILLLVAQWMENREAQITGTIATTLAFTVDNLLAPETCTEQW